MPATIVRTLQKWASLAGPLEQLNSSEAIQERPSFSLAFRDLIEKAATLRDFEFGELEEVIEQSNQRLKPLGEPMKHDFGLHRWLAGAREEAYSDWFQWLFARM